MDDDFKKNYVDIIGLSDFYQNKERVKCKVLKYPTPYNANRIVYMNHNKQCYKYNVEEVKCNESSITQPII